VEVISNISKVPEVEKDVVADVDFGIELRVLVPVVVDVTVVGSPSSHNIKIPAEFMHQIFFTALWQSWFPNFQLNTL